MNYKVNSKQRSKEYRVRILEISQKVPALHIAGAFSCLEIVDAIYFNFVRGDDSFILSKGHGAIAQYVVLEKLGILRSDDLDKYCTNEGLLGCHPDRGNPGIIASTGSLGHGIGLAVGIAAGKKIKNNAGNVYVVLSDGELQEGSTWENLMMAANLNLNNLIIFVDHNGFQSFGKTADTHPSFYPINTKFESFGWEVAETYGHDQQKISDAVKNRQLKKPFVLICNTTKGKGVSYMENAPIWHYRSPNAGELALALKEVMDEE
ncbi:transketolase [Polynucleobacter sp. AP-Feld-500C-C5]|uniref:transketolase n=1 Tax=Polynucleobacter sp. AP-Feld-500C-C5 TaxID=2576924 RepID=UPI00351D1C52